VSVASREDFFSKTEGPGLDIQTCRSEICFVKSQWSKISGVIKGFMT
jgi:hypothetical protein